MTTNPKSLAFNLERRELICELCLEWTSFDDLYVDDAGDRWDVCAKCGAIDAGAIETKEQA